MASLDPGIAVLRLENLQRREVSLPNELLSQIFECTCHIVISARTHGSAADHAIASCWMALSAILSTCSHWREVGLTTSSLWELVLVINPNYLAADQESGRIPMVTGIERAGNRALSLYVSRKLDAVSWDRTRTLLRPHITASVTSLPLKKTTSVTAGC